MNIDICVYHGLEFDVCQVNQADAMLVHWV